MTDRDGSELSVIKFSYSGKYSFFLSSHAPFKKVAIDILGVEIVNLVMLSVSHCLIWWRVHICFSGREDLCVTDRKKLGKNVDFY